MNKINQIVPISEMKLNQPQVLEMLNAGPVVLANRSKPAAVLVSIGQWDATADELARLRRIVKMDAALAAGDFVTHEEFTKLLAA